MCSDIVEKTAVYGSAKGANGWFTVDTANVYYDHPWHVPLDHALIIDFRNEALGPAARLGVVEIRWDEDPEWRPSVPLRVLVR